MTDGARAGAAAGRESAAGNGRGEDVFILMVEIGRKEDDGLPDGATGAALVCYCAAKDEKAAVDATVQVLREAGLAPLEVESWGTRAEPLGPVDVAADAALFDRALAENAVIVANMTTFTAEDEAPG
ncbi:MAG: hypothetical protein AAF371_08655 [Pseudomonadota bacterium]